MENKIRTNKEAVDEIRKALKLMDDIHLAARQVGKSSAMLYAYAGFYTEVKSIVEDVRSDLPAVYVKNLEKTAESLYWTDRECENQNYREAHNNCIRVILAEIQGKGAS